MSLAPAPAIGRAWLESRKAVDDGYIWPYLRHEMSAPGAIRERMVEDIKEMVHDGGADAVVTLQDLVLKGWTAEQTVAHGQPAFQIFRAEKQKAWKRRRFSQSIGTGIEAAALALFIGNLWFWAGVATGSL